jgi:CBS domain containing-hemolysin-like protein
MLHSEQALEEAYHHHKPDEIKGLTQNSINMLTSALSLHKIPVSAVMTPSTSMYCLYLDSKLDKETRKNILDSGFSRVPICYSEQYKFVVGILLTKKLISIEPGA